MKEKEVYSHDMEWSYKYINILYLEPPKYQVQRQCKQAYKQLVLQMTYASRL